MGHPAEHRGRRVVAARTLDDWRAWLERNGDSDDAVWLTLWKQGAGPGLLAYEDAVREALCHGWIDSTVNGFDADSYLILVAPRRAGSVWSAPNKARIAELEAAGRLLPRGAAAVARAKEDGSWTILDDAEALVEPEDLRARLDARPELRVAWEATTPGRRKQVLGQLALARTDATRTRRMEAAIAALAEGRPPA